MCSFLGTLHLTERNIEALETRRCDGADIRFVSFYTRGEVVYVYLEVDRAIESYELVEAWGAPSFFINLNGQSKLYYDHVWSRRGIQCVERGRKRFEFEI